MKKHLTFALAIIISFASLAQVESGSDIKAVAGSKTLELQFVPFGSSPVNINGIRFRKFSSATKAFRINAFLGVDSDTDITQQEDTDFDLEELKDRSTEIAISIRPGFENHIVVSDRLSPYFGAEFELALQTTTFRSEEQNGSEVNYVAQRNLANSGFLRLGANAIAGLDYYVAKKLYLGTEFGFGFSYTNFLSVNTKSDVDGFTEPDPRKQGSAFDLGPNVVAQIRLGYAF